MAKHWPKSDNKAFAVVLDWMPMELFDSFASQLPVNWTKAIKSGFHVVFKCKYGKSLNMSDSNKKREETNWIVKQLSWSDIDSHYICQEQTSKAISVVFGQVMVWSDPASASAPAPVSVLASASASDARCHCHSCRGRFRFRCRCRHRPANGIFN